jgi:hypothetical protein
VRRAVSGRSRSASSALGRDLERAFFADVYSVGSVVGARWRSSEEGLERAERREEEARRLRLRWLERASISSSAAKRGETGWSAGVGERDTGGVGRFEEEGSNGGMMALSVGAGWIESSSAQPRAEGVSGVPTSVGFGSGGAGVSGVPTSVGFRSGGVDLSFSSYSAARTTIEAGGAPRILSVVVGSGGSSRGVSKSIGPGIGRVYGVGESSEGAAFGEEGASDGFVGGGRGTREGGGGGGDNDLTDDRTVWMDKDDFERMEFRLGGTGGGVLERIDVLPDFIEVGEGERMGTASFVGSGEGGDFDRIEAFSTDGVGGNEVLGAGNRGGGKSAAVGEAALVVGKPAAWSSSLLCTTSSASSYKARPWW